MPPRRRGTPFARLDWARAPEPAAAARLHPRAAFVPPAGPPEPPANRLVAGDNLAVMSALLPELEGRVGLIYADPPFFSGKAFAARIGRDEDSRRPAGWDTLEAFSDTWPDGAGYLNMLYPRLQTMHRLLAPTGALVLHLDWRAAPYARLLLDEIFGPERLLNEIIWIYHGPSPIRSAFKRKHDTLLVYTRSKRYTFNADAVRVAYDPATVRTFRSSPRAGFGRVPDLARGKVPEDWWYFPVVARLHRERTGFPTQKPEALVERLVRAFSHPQDWVADFFCGSGTTPAVAGRLGRRWVACDRAPLALHTTYRRLLLEATPPGFLVQVQEGFETHATLQPRLRLERAGDGLEIHLTGLEGPGPLEFPADVDLWEIDPDHDGVCFRSRAQAVRPWRSEALPLSLRLEAARGLRPRVAVRAHDRYGRHGTAEVQLPDD